MVPLTFSYQNENLTGLFDYVRKSAQNTVVLYSFASHITKENEYCSKYIGKEASSLIDGDLHTAWANSETNTTDNQYFIVDLGIGSFLLDSIDFSTTCNAPDTIKILGSNNNKSFHPICTINDMHENDQIYHRTCKSYYNSYRYFKFQQTESVIGKNRFHLSEIEFYGILNPIINSCQYNNIYSIRLSLCCQVFIFSYSY